MDKCEIYQNSMLYIFHLIIITFIVRSFMDFHFLFGSVLLL